MPKIVITNATFERIYEREIKPDLDFRLEQLEFRQGELSDQADFLKVMTKMWEAMTEVSELRKEREARGEKGDTPFDWDLLLPLCERMTAIARSRCSIG